jgi:hypothetical protein
MFVGALVGVLILTLLIVWLRTPTSDPACPDPGAPCANPPVGSGALVIGTLWTTSSGVQVEYDDTFWEVDVTTDDELRLSDGNGGEVWIQIDRSITAQAAADRRIEDLRRSISDITSDDAPEHEILGPSIGYRDGEGDAYGGTIDTAQGPGAPVRVAVMSAEEDDVTVTVSVVGMEVSSDGQRVVPVFYWADSLLNTLRWPSESR